MSLFEEGVWQAPQDIDIEVMSKVYGQAEEIRGHLTEGGLLHDLEQNQEVLRSVRAQVLAEEVLRGTLWRTVDSVE